MAKIKIGRLFVDSIYLLKLLVEAPKRVGNYGVLLNTNCRSLICSALKETEVTKGK